jgi:hypothetical protein
VNPKALEVIGRAASPSMTVSWGVSRAAAIETYAGADGETVTFTSSARAPVDTQPASPHPAKVMRGTKTLYIVHLSENFVWLEESVDAA